MKKVQDNSQEKTNVIKAFRRENGDNSYRSRIVLCLIVIACNLVGIVVSLWYFFNKGVKDYAEYDNINKLGFSLGHFTEDNFAKMHSLQQVAVLDIAQGVFLGIALFIIAFIAFFFLLINIYERRILNTSNIEIDVLRAENKEAGINQKYYLDDRSTISRLIGGAYITCTSSAQPKKVE